MTARPVRTAADPRAIWARGESAVMGWVHMPSVLSAEVMGAAGYDVLVVDMQHGPVTHQDAVAMLPAVLAAGCVPLVRVHSPDSELIGPLLDAGAMGIVAPQVDTRAQAEAVVAACRYPPRGHRSFGPLRIGLHVEDYVARAHEQVLAFAVIESVEALGNLDEIVSTPGLDGVMLGPTDLCIDARGKRPSEYDAELQEWTRRIVARAKAHGVAVALIALCDDDVEFLLGLRPEVLMLGSDLELLMTGARHALDTAVDRLATAGLRSGGSTPLPVALPASEVGNDLGA